MSDCGSSSCRGVLPEKRTGMRNNGPCRCDRCPECGADVHPPIWHHEYCSMFDTPDDHPLGRLGIGRTIPWRCMHGLERAHCPLCPV